MPPKMKVEIQLTARSLDHRAVTQKLGISPTRTWTMGDDVQGSPVMARKNDGWVWSTAEVEGFDLASVLIDALTIVTPKAELLRDVANQIGAEIQVRCNITSHDDLVPAMHFAPSVLAQVADLGGPLDIDLIFEERE